MTNREFLEKLNDYNFASVIVSLVIVNMELCQILGRNAYETDKMIREKTAKWLKKERKGVKNEKNNRN